MTASFPGGVALSDLEVYDTESSDGCRGGTPHLHTVSSEGYVVVGGVGAVQTLSAAGFDEHPLQPGDVLSFTPGTVHRLVNGGGLRLLVVMANAGLPEAGDAVFTFPAEVRADAAAYRQAAMLPEGEGRDAAVRARRELALVGFAELRSGGVDAVRALHADAARLVGPRVAQWRETFDRTVAAETMRVSEQLDALASGAPGILADARVERARERGGPRAYGMCGMLRTWEWQAEQE
jgi:mannose-6-phosphate isomerase-like protein (cupin superfamily)